MGIVRYFISKKIVFGFVVTSAVNFLSISILLIFSLKYIKNPGSATLVAHFVGLFLSMLFTLDFWWGRITKEINLPVSGKQRIHFLLIGAVTAIVAWISVRKTGEFQVLSKFEVIAINWLTIGAIAVFKFALFVVLVRNQSR